MCHNTFGKKSQNHLSMIVVLWKGTQLSMQIDQPVCPCSLISLHCFKSGGCDQFAYAQADLNIN